MALLTANILLVDDDELNCELLKRRLEADHHTVTALTTGNKALELIKDNKFDLVLLDIMLPDINGVDVLEKIKQDPVNDGLHVMMVTANGDREMVLKCLDEGATDYLVKPFSMQVVKARLQRILLNTTTATIDYKNTKILLVDDQELNRDVLAHRLNKSGYKITSVTNGQEALTLLKNNSFDLILLDIMMPDISGIEVLKELRSMDLHKNSPVIMITALDDVNTVNECMDAGANDYLTKPLNTVLLKLRITSCLESQQYKTKSS